MKKLIAILLVAVMVLSLAGCTTYVKKETSVAVEEITEAGSEEEKAEAVAPSIQDDETETAETEAVTEETAAAGVTGHDLTSGSPWIASTVEGVVTEDTPEDLKEDFYVYVNKDKILSQEFPTGYPVTGTIVQRSIDNDKDILSLFSDTEAKSEDGQQALDLYELLMDWDKRNEQGVEPLKKRIDKLEAIKSIDGLTKYFKDTPLSEQASALFIIGLNYDADNSSEFILDVAPSGLLLSDSAEYSELTESGEMIKQANSELVLYMLRRLGYKDEEAKEMLDNCLEFESKLAPSIMTATEQNSPDAVTRITNKMTIAELKEAQGKLPILESMDNEGFARKEAVNVSMPEWLEKLNSLYNDDNLELIKDYLIVHAAYGSAEFLDKDCFKHVLDRNNALNGTEGYLSDEEYASQYVSTLLPWQVAKLYCEKFTTQEDKDKVTDIMEKVIAEYSEMLDENTFLSEETKAKAKEKLDAMTLRSLYPDDWSPYSYKGLKVTGNKNTSILDAVEKISEASTKKSVKKFTKPVDKTVWEVYPPTTVNAFYNPADNSINMLAAFCRGDLYNSDMSVEEQYAKIGEVIGHEISHAFDGTGSQYDKDGNLNNWWTEEDRRSFDEKIDKIAKYASNMTYWDDVHYNGQIQTGEICADMGGMAVVLRMAEDIEDFDYDKFFKTYADLWQQKSTYNYMVNSKMSDEHPAENFRVNGTLQQFDEFLDCYDIKEGDNMYLSPEDRVAIW